MLPLIAAMKPISMLLTAIESRSPLGFLIGNFILSPILPPLFLLQDLMMLFATYESRQKVVDAIDATGASPGTWTQQKSLALISRIGPKTTYWGIIILSAVPSGSSSNFPTHEPLYVFGILGGLSTLGRAFMRGDARTVAVLLHSAPSMQLKGVVWKRHKIYDRDDLIRWITARVRVDSAELRRAYAAAPSAQAAEQLTSMQSIRGFL